MKKYVAIFISIAALYFSFSFKDKSEKVKQTDSKDISSYSRDQVSTTNVNKNLVQQHKRYLSKSSGQMKNKPENEKVIKLKSYKPDESFDERGSNSTFIYVSDEDFESENSHLNHSDDSTPVNAEYVYASDEELELEDELLEPKVDIDPKYVNSVYISISKKEFREEISDGNLDYQDPPKDVNSTYVLMSE